MASKSGKSWVDMFSIKNIKLLVSEKHKCIIDPYDFFEIGEPTSAKNSLKQSKSTSPILPTIKKRLILTRSNILSNSKHSILRPGIGEEAFKKINTMCNNTRKKLKTVINSCNYQKIKLKIKYKQCAKVAKNAYEDRFSEGLPQELLNFRTQLKAKRKTGKLQLDGVVSFSNNLT